MDECPIPTRDITRREVLYHLSGFYRLNIFYVVKLRNTVQSNKHFVLTAFVSFSEAVPCLQLFSAQMMREGAKASISNVPACKRMEIRKQVHLSLSLQLLSQALPGRSGKQG